jgi:predicted TIM-barrel fold metal-dependent hydrolase
VELPTSGANHVINEDFDTSSHLAHARKQAIERNYKDFLIVDVDCHHYETERFGEIIEYIEDPVLKQLALSSQRTGKTLMARREGHQDMGGRVLRYPMRKTEKTPPGQDRDAALSHRFMNAFGVDYAVLFPTAMLSLGLHPQPEFEVSLAWAYNRWLVERVLADNQPRIKSLLYLPFNDPEASYEMVKAFAGKPGVCGFMVTTVRYKPVHDNAYMKVYRLLEENNLPLAFHAGFNANDRSFEQANRFITVHALGFTFYNMLNIFNWVVNGLPERFPKLKVIWLESGLAWLPFCMQRMDNEYMMRSSECPALKKLPSEYITDMFYGCQPMEMTANTEMLEQTFKFIKADTQLLYASDYPHWDFDAPSVIYDLPFLNESQKRAILGGNAQRVFNLPFSEKLAKI